MNPLEALQYQAAIAWRNRYIIWALTHYQRKAVQRTKILGVLWALLDPLLFILTYTILVVFIFNRGEPQYPVLLFSVLLNWYCFIRPIVASVGAISARTHMVKGTRLPLIVLPLSEVLYGLMDYAFGLIILIPLMLAFSVPFTPYILYLPLILALQTVFCIGACLIASIIGTYLKDLSNLLAFGFRLWFYLSPGLYSVANRIPDRFQLIYHLNPFAWLFETYKDILVRGTAPSPEYIYIPVIFAVATLIIGAWYFTKEEHHLAKSL
jgi:ABC-type polysaccharide/polyol phosphate export permease